LIPRFVIYWQSAQYRFANGRDSTSLCECPRLPIACAIRPRGQPQLAHPPPAWHRPPALLLAAAGLSGLLASAAFLASEDASCSRRAGPCASALAMPAPWLAQPPWPVRLVGPCRSLACSPPWLFGAPVLWLSPWSVRAAFPCAGLGFLLRRASSLTPPLLPRRRLALFVGGSTRTRSSSVSNFAPVARHVRTLRVHTITPHAAKSPRAARGIGAALGLQTLRAPGNHQYAHARSNGNERLPTGVPRIIPQFKPAPPPAPVACPAGAEHDR